MKILKKALSLLAVLVVLLVVIGLFLPDSAHVQRGTIIEAPPSEVFPLVNDFRTFGRWYPWTRIDPDIRYTFAGPQAGVGAKMAWVSNHPKVGSGSQEIIASKLDRHVSVTLDFGAQTTATARFDLQPWGQGTRITWSFDMDFGYDLICRYIGLLFDRMVGGDYEQGLANLKELSEGVTRSRHTAERLRILDVA